MNADIQASYECEVFRHFAAAAGLEVAHVSSRSHKPPHPDVSCRTVDGCELAFELVQVVDQGLARTGSDQRYLQACLRKVYDALPTVRRDRLERIRSVTGVVIAGTIIAKAPWPEDRVAGCGPCDGARYAGDTRLAYATARW